MSTKTAITNKTRWCSLVCARLHMLSANGLGRCLKQFEAKVPARSACRRRADQPSTAIPTHAALMMSPALNMASAPHLFCQSAAGLMASAPMISEFANSKALWRAQRVSRSEFIRLV